MIASPLQAALGLLLAVSLLAVPLWAAEREEVSLLYLSRADDPDYQSQRRYTGLFLREAKSPIEGARLGVRDSRIRGRALGLTFSLEERLLEEGEDAVAILAEEEKRAVLLDLPYEEIATLVSALGDREDLLLFNIRHPDRALREELCRPALLHILPSFAMLGDALAQYLAERGWRDILVLEDESPESQAWSQAFQASAEKFGLEVIERRTFELTNDPRRRDRSNLDLLTAGADYDVVFLADAFGEFGRYLPYATQLPRPVVGSEGLGPEAWHWTWERHGAPQLNQRFRKRAKRDMMSSDWATWVAVRAFVEALSRAETRDVALLRRFMTSDDFTLDVYKGTAGNFRPWNGQLRQNLLLATHNAVIERAPLDDFLHETNNLDSLGIDRRESGCRNPPGG